MISKSSIDSPSSRTVDATDRLSPTKRRKGTGAHGLLKPGPRGSVETDAPIGPSLAERMKEVGHDRAVETVDWLSEEGLLTNDDRQALARLDPADVKDLLTVSRFGDGVWKRSQRNDVRRAVLLYAARHGVAKARQLKQDLLGTFAGGRGLDQLRGDDATFEPRELRRRLDTLVVDHAVVDRLRASGHDRAAQTYGWLCDSGMLDVADKGRLHNIADEAPGDVKNLLTVSKWKDEVADLADRQNIRRAVMLCAAKHGLEAAQDLKERLLETYQSERGPVRGFQSLDANDCESFESVDLDERLRHLAIDDTNFRRLDDQELPEARSSYAWLDAQKLLAVDDKQQLSQISNHELGQLLMLDDGQVGDAGDRRNVRRALMLCASKEGLAAARRLKEGLLAEGQVRFENPDVTVEVPGYAQLRTPWSKSDGARGDPSGLWVRLADGRSDGRLDANAQSDGAADVFLKHIVQQEGQLNHLDERQRARLDHIVAQVDRRLDPMLPPERRLRALCQLVQHTSTKKFMNKTDEVLEESGVDPKKAAPERAFRFLLHGLGKARFGLEPDLRDALVAIPTESRLRKTESIGRALGGLGLPDEQSELGADISRYLQKSGNKVRQAAHTLQRSDEFIFLSLHEFGERFEAATASGAPRPAPAAPDGRQVRFDPKVTGKTYDPLDDPTKLRGQSEEDMTGRQLAALRGAYMVLKLAHELSIVPSASVAISNAVRDTRNVEQLSIEELKHGIQELQ